MHILNSQGTVLTSQERIHIQLSSHSFCVYSAGFRGLRKFHQLLLHSLWRPSQQEFHRRWTIQHEISQTGRPRKHHIQVEPPVLQGYIATSHDCQQTLHQRISDMTLAQRQSRSPTHSLLIFFRSWTLCDSATVDYHSLVESAPLARGGRQHLTMRYLKTITHVGSSSDDIRCSTHTHTHTLTLTLTSNVAHRLRLACIRNSPLAAIYDPRLRPYLMTSTSNCLNFTCCGSRYMIDPSSSRSS